MHAVYYKTLKLALGIQAVSAPVFIESMYPIVKSMLDKVCEAAKQEMKEKKEGELRSWKCAVTTAGGTWHTRGWHSKNATFTIRNYLNGAFLYYQHLCQKGRDHVIEEELYKGTSKSSEGYAAHITFLRAKEEGMQVATLIPPCFFFVWLEPCSLTHALIHSRTHAWHAHTHSLPLPPSLPPSLTPSLPHSLPPFLTQYSFPHHSLTHSLTHSLIHSLAHSLSLTLSLNLSLTHSLSLSRSHSHSPTHSLTHAFTHARQACMHCLLSSLSTSSLTLPPSLTPPSLPHSLTHSLTHSLVPSLPLALPPSSQGSHLAIIHNHHDVVL